MKGYASVSCFIPSQPYHLLSQSNILVDKLGRARLNDFGLNRIASHNYGGLSIPDPQVQDPDSFRSTTSYRDYDTRWTAPEILGGGKRSQKGDIFSFAIVMVEVRHDQSTTGTAFAQCRCMSAQVFAGTIPFGEGPDHVIMRSVLQGERPERPTHPTFTKALWSLMQRCWDHDPKLRPTASEVTETLEVLHFGDRNVRIGTGNALSSTARDLGMFPNPAVNTSSGKVGLLVITFSVIGGHEQFIARAGFRERSCLRNLCRIQ